MEIEDCPEYLVALLEHIDYELTRIMENRTQEDYPSPFSNSGNVPGYTNDTFEVHAYDWNWDGDESEQEPPNFKYKDIEIWWYKYLGRGMCMNKPITPEQAVEMFNACIDSLRYEEAKYEKELQCK